MTNAASNSMATTNKNRKNFISICHAGLPPSAISSVSVLNMAQLEYSSRKKEHKDMPPIWGQEFCYQEIVVSQYSYTIGGAYHRE